MNYIPIIRAFVAILLLLVSGCGGLKLRQEDGIHHIILGVGVVSVPLEKQESVEIVRTHSLGLNMMLGVENALTAGYAFVLQIIARDGVDDVCTEIASSPMGKIVVDTSCGQGIVKSIREAEDRNRK